MPTATTAYLTLCPILNRPSTRAYVRTIVGKPSTSVGLTADDQAARAASAASASAAGASSDTTSSDVSPPAQPGPVTTGKDVLLEGTVRSRTGLSWYRPTRVQLLAAPAHDGASDTPAWSALVTDGVAVPYEEVARVRVDEGALEFIIEHKSTPQAHMRFYARAEFNLWREALGPKITGLNSMPLGDTSVVSKPSAVHAAQKWLAHAEDATAPCA